MYDSIDFEEFKRVYPIKRIPNYRGLSTIAYEKDAEFIRRTNAYIQYNAKYTWDILINEMSTHIPETIENMEKKIKELTSQIENISIETIKEGSSKYGKTKFKQQNNELASKSKKNRDRDRDRKIKKWLK